MAVPWEPKLVCKVPGKAKPLDLIEDYERSFVRGHAQNEGILAKNSIGTSRKLASESGDIRSFYKFGKELGRGHFGIVRACEDLETSEAFACKTILKTSLKKKEEIDELRAEIEVMRHLKGHENVVEMREIYEDKEAVHLVMELCHGGDLFDYIARRRCLQEVDAARILRQAVLAMKHCHDRGVIHRDMKPENILFSNLGDGESFPHVKIADFGLAVMPEPGKKASGLAGSPFYMAPELVRREKYGPEIDIWSLGVVLYTALSGFLPFWGKNHEQTFAAVLIGKPDYSKKPWPGISREARRLVRWMLHMDPSSRATVEDILNNPWLLQHCPDQISTAQARHFSFEPALCQAPVMQPTNIRAIRTVSNAICGSPETSPSNHDSSAGHDKTQLSPSNSSATPAARRFLNRFPSIISSPFTSAPSSNTPPVSPRSPRGSPTFALGATARKGLYILFNSQPVTANPGRHELVMQRPLDKSRGVMPVEDVVLETSGRGADALYPSNVDSNRPASPRSPLDQHIFPLTPRMKLNC